VFNSGVLADPDGHASYDYAPAASDVVARVRDLRARCAAHGIDLPAAALQFARRHAAVSTVVIGARSGAEVEVDTEYASTVVPDDLWPELDLE
jgi:D-threo-aldose 1-dehydrogenase